MSGGHFQYEQYKCDQLADQVDRLVASNDDDSLDEWGQPKGRHYSDETIRKFREAASTLRRSSDMLQRIDWLVSGDDGEDAFHRRWTCEVRPINDPGKEKAPT